MKKNFTRASMLAVMAALAVGSLSAKDVYLSPDGDDANDGLSAATPRKTLTNLTSILETGDVVNISGILSMANEYDLAVLNNNLSKGHCGHFYKEGNQNGFQLKIDDARWANITFRGVDPEMDGFDGDNAWRFFELGRETNFSKWVNPENTVENAWVRFENLSFKNGVAPSEGGTFYIHDHIVADFDHCVFENNGFDKTLLKQTTEGAKKVYDAGACQERGGAIHFQFGALNITNSVFKLNTARRGGAICQTGGDLKLEDCLFENNGSMAIDPNGEIASRNIDGGALCLWTLHTSTNSTINRCSFVGNACWNKGGAIWIPINVDGSPDRIVDATITNSYFGMNDAVWEHGGAIAVENAGAPDGFKHVFLKVANCLFNNNTSAFYGPQIYWKAGNKNSLFSLTNCSMIGGGTNGNRGDTNGGHGANICFDGADTRPTNDITVEIFNTIMEGNKCGNGDYSDISFLNATAKNITDMHVDQCAIASIVGDENATVKSSTSLLGYDQTTAPCYSAGAYELGSALVYNNMLWGAAPVDPVGPAGTLGDKQYYVKPDKTVNITADKTWTIKGFDISASDMHGKPRGENAVIGSNEIDENTLIDYSEANKDLTEDFPISGIEDVTVESGKLLVKVVNGVVTATETARFVAYAPCGMKVAESRGSLDLNQLAGGVYLIAVSDGADFAVVKVAK